MRNSDRYRRPQNAYQKVEAAITPTRASAVVYYAIEIHSESLVDYLKEHQLRFFSYVLYVCKETVLKHPFLNDFILGGKRYAHTSMIVSTAMKKDIQTEGGLSQVKIALEAEDGPLDIQLKMDNLIKNVRSSKDTGFNALIDTLNLLPMFLYRFVLFIGSILVGWGFLPKSVIHADPLHSSAVIANLGSVKGDAVFHHLYEWGTGSLFIAVGRLSEQGDVTIRFTIDERISEGLQLFSALDTFKSLMEHPYDRS
ncbi:MAG: hypothetical protein E4G74_00620 [Erysipelotrichales bacterium]|nr:MAG: hypothetical protein E4G74_00620 [Erysipelotrichales bacterium]